MPKKKQQIDTTTRKAWHKQHRESKKIYEFFQHYLLMHGRRSVRRVKEELNLADNYRLDEAATRWRWTQRARLFDEYKQEQVDNARIQSFVDMERRQGEAGKAMQALAIQEMGKLLEESKAKRGERIMRVSDVVRLMELGVQLEKESLGQGKLDSGVPDRAESAAAADEAAQRAVDRMAELLGVDSVELAAEVH
jgi:hypothetical protein